MSTSQELAGPRGKVLRTRLLSLLAPQSERRLRLLHAPAGFGKTELARQFVAQHAPERLVWLDAHGLKMDQATLLARLAVALGLAATASLLDVEAVLGRCQAGLVVLDGYWADTLTDKWLGRLIDNTPASVQWLVCCRARPRWPIARWLLEERLVLLEGDALAFTLAEVQALCQQLPHLSQQSAEELWRQSGGWVAGIRLYSLSPAALNQGKGALHRMGLVEDYLDTEVLEGLTPAIHSLLCVIAHAPFVDAQLCAFLADDPRALRVLLEQQVFLQNLPGSADRFTLYPPLKCLLQERYPDQVAPLLAASQWLHLAGAHVEAFRYALAAGDTSRALISLGQAAPRELYVGQNLSYLLEGIDQLGEDWLSEHPQALEMIARSLLLGGRLDAAQRILQLLMALDRPIGDALQAELALHQGQAHVALQVGLPALDGLVKAGQWAQMIACLSCLTRASLALGDIASAKRLQLQGLELSRRHGEGLLECLLMLDQAQIDELTGNLPHALYVLEQIDGLLAQGPYSAFLQGCKQIRRGWLLMLTGQELPARATLEDGLRLAQACHCPVTLYAHTLLAQLDTNKGDVAAAQLRLSRAQRQMHGWNVAEVIYRGVLSISSARVWLRINQFASAGQLLTRLREQYQGEQALTPPSSFPELSALLGFLQAEWLCSRGSLRDAGQVLDSVLAWAQESDFDILVCQAQYALGEVRRLKGDMHQSERLLASAAAMAVHQGQHNLLTGIHSGTAEQRLNDNAAALRVEPLMAEAELLSQRELVVLGLIAKGYSNNEIANLLSLSLHTVKTHAKHINAKLKVSNRTMAAARAKALGLLL